MDKPLLYEVLTWRNPPGYSHYITVATTLASLKADLGHVPATLDDEPAVRSFASLVNAPLVGADIESDLDFPQWKWASRQWVRAEYERFHAWCGENGYLETDRPRRGRPRKLEPAAV